MFCQDQDTTLRCVSAVVSGPPRGSEVTGSERCSVVAAGWRHWQVVAVGWAGPAPVGGLHCTTDSWELRERGAAHSPLTLSVTFWTPDYPDLHWIMLRDWAARLSDRNIPVSVLPLHGYDGDRTPQRLQVWGEDQLDVPERVVVGREAGQWDPGRAPRRTCQDGSSECPLYSPTNTLEE